MAVGVGLNFGAIWLNTLSILFKHFRLKILITYFKHNLQYVNFCIYTLYINSLYYTYVISYTKTRERDTKIEMNFFFFSHPNRSFYTPAEMCPAHLAAAGCIAWMKKTRRPIWGPIFSLVVTVISDKLDHLIEWINSRKVHRLLSTVIGN